MTEYNLQNLREEGDKFKGKKVLLHCCCAVCAVYVSQILKEVFGEVVLYFYNPNIQPEEEYRKRLEAMRKVAEIRGLELIEGQYHPEKWLEAVRGLENEPEGGERCEVCFEIRMKETAGLAKEKGFDFFATTLTVGPRKKALIINEICGKIKDSYEIGFIAADFKKKDGFKESLALAKEQDLYRQNYCGCAFSLEEKQFVSNLNPKT